MKKILLLLTITLLVWAYFFLAPSGSEPPQPVRHGAEKNIQHKKIMKKINKGGSKSSTTGSKQVPGEKKPTLKKASPDCGEEENATACRKTKTENRELKKSDAPLVPAKKRDPLSGGSYHLGD